jgi:hypothetical protein
MIVVAIILKIGKVSYDEDHKCGDDTFNHTITNVVVNDDDNNDDNDDYL